MTNKRKDRRKFRQIAAQVKTVNIKPRPFRGGIRF